MGQVAPIAINGEPVTFAKHVADRLGLSADATKRLNRISQNLNPDLRHVLRGTAVADNQAQLLRLAKLEPMRQRQVALAFREMGDDLRGALSLIGERQEQEAACRREIQAVEQDVIHEQSDIYAQLITFWELASWETRARFKAHCWREGMEEDGEAVA